MDAETQAAETTDQVTTTTDDSASLETVEAKDSAKDQEQKLKDPDLERALRDLHKFKRLAAERDEELKASKVNELKRQEKWEELAKQYEQEASTERERASKLESGIQYDRKYNAVKDLALASGLRKEALSDLELLEFDDIELELTSTGRVNVLNADRAVERLKQSRPHWFGNRKASFNANDPGIVGATQISFADIKKAEDAARKSGDYAPYEKVLKQFREQKRSR
jgi:hypothetical protein